MTEQELFEAVLRELAELLLDLGDLSRKVVLIGGQVLAIQSLRNGGTGEIRVETGTELVIPRGFSFEPDLLFDLEEHDFMAERLTQVLLDRGYRRVREFRWEKPLKGKEPIRLDLFAPETVPPDALPTPMTPLPDADLAIRRSSRVELALGGATLRISIPDPVAFLTLKLRAKLEQRPSATKDSFDIYAYVRLLGHETVSASLAQSGEEGRWVRRQLKTLFWDMDSAGVRDVLSFATTYDPDDQALLAQDVVDLFDRF